jgi:ferredoxin
MAKARFDKATDFQIMSERCVNCLYCQLACSFVKVHRYEPASAFVRVERDLTTPFPERYRIRFTEECDGCGVCLDYCYFNAIRNLKKPEKDLGLPEPKVSHTFQ